MPASVKAEIREFHARTKALQQQTTPIPADELAALFDAEEHPEMELPPTQEEEGPGDWAGGMDDE